MACLSSHLVAVHASHAVGDDNPNQTAAAAAVVAAAAAAVVAAAAAAAAAACAFACHAAYQLVGPWGSSLACH